ncbi:MAG: hypothetical protein K0R54_5605 [Clostridiaceae bacterium]|nr:hypothetical protein [Clostridiaceae bacterium]
MVSEIKNILLAGIGSAAYTYEKATKLVDEFVQKGKLTVEEGKELSEELKRTIKDKTENIKDKAENIKPLTKEDMVTLLRSMDFASKSDLNQLNERLLNLEEKLNETK